MPLYEMECPAGHVDNVVRKIERRDDQHRCTECGLETERKMSMPHVQTINTHMKGTQVGTDGMGYYDYNLRDKATGKPAYITSLDQKRNLLKERGLEEVGDDTSLPGALKRQDDEKAERRKSIVFS